jgi:2'-5' RNA ligase
MTNSHDAPFASETPEAGQAAGAQRNRIFVGIKVEPELARQLALLAKREHIPFRYVPADDLHLTLLPPWNEVSVPDAVAKLRQALEGFGCFLLSFERLCYGPQARRPRLLWAECTPNAEIVGLRNALLSTFGQANDRPFRPHVTLARIEKNGGTIAEENPIDQALWLNQRVESVELFRSPTPGESGYEVVASLPLQHVVTTRG